MTTIKPISIGGGGGGMKKGGFKSVFGNVGVGSEEGVAGTGAVGGGRGDLRRYL